MNKKSFSEFFKLKESGLDGTQGYDMPLSKIGQEVVQMCQHYFQTMTDQQINQIGSMIQQIAGQNRGQAGQNRE